MPRIAKVCATLMMMASAIALQFAGAYAFLALCTAVLAWRHRRAPAPVAGTRPDAT